MTVSPGECLFVASEGVKLKSWPIGGLEPRNDGYSLPPRKANLPDCHGKVFAIVRRIMETTRMLLLEAIAETIAREVLTGFPAVDEVTVRVRKPKVQLPGRLDYSGVEITRRA